MQGGNGFPLPPSNKQPRPAQVRRAERHELASYWVFARSPVRKLGAERDSMHAAMVLFRTRAGLTAVAPASVSTGNANDRRTGIQAGLEKKQANNPPNFRQALKANPTIVCTGCNQEPPSPCMIQLSGLLQMSATT